MWRQHSQYRGRWYCAARDETAGSDDESFESIEAALNAYGSRGWELVGVVGGRHESGNATYSAFFKAPA